MSVGTGDAASDAPPINIGVIGLGFMGSTHVRCYAAAQAAGHGCRLSAVADHDPRKLTGAAGTAGNIATGAAERLFDPGVVRAFERPADLLADSGVHAVSICTHTRTHVDLAIAALRAGKHVLVEKPLALEVASAERLREEAGRHPGLVCMAAMVMRFWPGWSMVREAVRSREHGALRSLALSRRGSTPTWSGFYADPEQSGGALFDLHVHDSDFVLWCLGTPAAVSSTGDLSHVTTIYRYARGVGGGPAPVHVMAEGGMDHDPAYGFHIRMTAAFERATIDFDLSRTPNLRAYKDGRAIDVAAPAEGAFDLEVRAFVDAVRRARASPGMPAPQPVAVGEAVSVLRLLHAERESLEGRREVAV